MSISGPTAGGQGRPGFPEVGGICYGGDYNPEQWPREVWEQDAALMRQAGVNLVSLGIFSWALIEPREGEYDFGWLDHVIDLLHTHGIRVGLGTPTAAPPGWFYARYPDSRVVTREGTVLGPGSRGMVAPTSPEYRAAAVRVASRLADRYGTHPAVAMWHVHNEYGAPVGEDYSIHALRAWRTWLRERYGSLDTLNAAWGTRFWGQIYGEWGEVTVPAASASVVNPAQRLDFARFTDAMLRECFIAERDAIRARSPRPVTTNFMAVACPTTDVFAWAREVDVVANDHYLTAADPRSQVGLALAADLTRSAAGGKPWMLLEHSASAVNWQPRNIAKRPGEEARNAFSHLGRGADAIMFFQWRASRCGAEKFHSAMLPHAGTDSRVWREVVQLGADLKAAGELRGSRTLADVALLWDQESFWAQDLEWRPSIDARHDERITAFYDRLWRDGITVDFAQPSQDLSRYRLVIAPASYLLTKDAAANLTQYAEGGGTLLVSFFSGIVDEFDRVHDGGLMAPLRDVLGVWVEEFLPLREHQTVTVAGLAKDVTGTVWADDLVVTGAEVVATYVDGPAAGRPAITRHARGKGHGWYVSTSLGAGDLAPLMARVYADAGVTPLALPDGVEVVVRSGATADYVVAINHTCEDVTLTGAQRARLLGSGPARDLLTGETLHAPVSLPAGTVRVLRTPTPRPATGRVYGSVTQNRG